MTTTTNTRHPFAPLNPGELEEAVALVRATEAGSSEHIRFVMARLHEPSPEVALSYRPGNQISREVFFVLLDKTPGQSCAYEDIVNLTEGKVNSSTPIQGQPSSFQDESLQAVDATRPSPLV